MLDIKKVLHALLYPPTWLLLLLVPLATVLLILSMTLLGSESIPSYGAYVLAAYALTAVCFRIPRLVSLIKRLKTEHKLLRALSTDAHLRIRLSLNGSFVFNTAYALLQSGLGLYYRSLWYLVTAAYYFLLALMRMLLLRYTLSHKPGEDMAGELKRARLCGVALLIFSLALAGSVTYTVLFEDAESNGMIPTIAMAAYTFTTLTVAIVNVVRYRKYQSPVFSAAKRISLATAVVSMLTLESSMLAAFDNGEMDADSRLFLLAATGFAVMVFVLYLAVSMTASPGKHCQTRENKRNGALK